MQAPFLVLDTAAAALYADALDCLRDVQCANEAATSLLGAWPTEGKAPPLAWALWNAALVAYVRAFSGGVRKFDLKRFLAPLGPEAAKAHQYFKNTRNKHVAHSVNAMSESAVMVAVGPPPGFDILAVGSYLDTFSASRETVQLFQRLTSELYAAISPAIETLKAGAEASAHRLTSEERSRLQPWTRRIEGADSAGTRRRKR